MSSRWDAWILVLVLLSNALIGMASHPVMQRERIQISQILIEGGVLLTLQAVLAIIVTRFVRSMHRIVDEA